MRLLTAANRNAVNASRLQIVWLVRLRLTPPIGDIHLCSAQHTITWGGIEYLGAGALLDIEFPEEDASLEARAGTITLNGLDPAIINLALNTMLEGAVVHIFALMRDPETHAAVDAPFVMYRGTISEVRISQPFTGGDN